MIINKTNYNSQEKVTIVGAGISGLFLGYYLKKNNIPFQILEQSNRIGGLLGSHRNQFGLAEQAANGFLYCKELELLSHDLNLPILNHLESSKARYLLRKKVLRKWPLSISETLFVLFKALKPRKQKFETLEEFSLANFGKTFTQQILTPAMGGIYAAQLSDLNFEAIMPDLAKNLEKTTFLPFGILKFIRAKKKQSNSKNKSKIKGTIAFENGMQDLVQALGNFLKQEIKLNSPLEKIPKSPTILTCPAAISANFFEEKELQNILNNIVYQPVVSLTIFVKKDQLKKIKTGFGCLIPRNEGFRFLGILFNNFIFSNRVSDENLMSLTLIGGNLQESELIQFSDSDLLDLAKKELQEILGLEGNILDFELFRWKNGIPLYNTFLLKSWNKLEKLLLKKQSNVALFGNYTGQISIRGLCQEASKICQ